MLAKVLAMMRNRRVTYNMHDAKTHLSQLVECARLGDEVFIAKDGDPVVRLVPVGPGHRERPAGLYAGRIEIHDDFDAPLPQGMTGLGAGPEPSAKRSAGAGRRRRSRRPARPAPRA